MQEPRNPTISLDNEALKNSEERLQTLINASPDIICFKDAEGRWMQANESLLSLYCLNGVDYHGKTEFELADYTAPIYQEAFRNCQGSDDKAWEAGTTIRAVEMIPDVHGIMHVFDVVKVPLYFPDGSRKGIVVFGRDITDIKEHETALRENEKKYRQIAENTSDVIWMMNDQLQYTYVSPSILRQRGYTQEEYLSLRPSEIYSPETFEKVLDIFRTNMALAKEGKIPMDYTLTTELVHKCKDGTLRVSEVLISPVFDSDGRITGAHGVSRDITERRQSEKAIRESEDKFHGFFENAPIGIWEEDLSGIRETLETVKMSGKNVREFLNNAENVKLLASLVRVIDINQASVEISGGHDKESVRKNLPYYFDEKSYVVFREEMIALSEGKLAFSVEIPVRSDKGRRILNLNLAIQPGHEFTWKSVLVSFVDITTRREAEQRIEIMADVQSRLLKMNELKEIHDLIVETVHRIIGEGIVFTTNIDLQSQSGGMVSHRGLKIPRNEITRLLGLDPSEMKFYLKDITPEELRLYRSGRLELMPGGLYALVTRRFPEVVMTGLEKLLNIKKIYTIGFVYQETHLGGLIILARGDLSDYAETIEMIVSQASITMNRIKAEIGLREMQDRFRLAFRTSPDAININSLETGMHVEVNEGFSKITGYSREEVIGRTSTEINMWDNSDDRARMVAMLKKEGNVTNFEAIFRYKNGTRHTGLMSASLIHLNGVPHILSITRDIEELKQAERDLIKAKESAEESSRLKTAFLNNISHEVRTPMNAILGFTDILQSGEVAQADQDHYFNIVKSNAKQLLSIIDDVLEISRMDSGRIPLNPVLFSIGDLLADIHLSMNELVTGKGLQFSIEIETNGHSGYAIADMEKIRQVITGLVENAIKFTVEGSICIGCIMHGAELEFYVRDTGIGIDPSEHERIFERFYQGFQGPVTGMRGTGLGLSIARGLVDMMEGSIRVDSVKGQGSTFIFVLPYWKSAAPVAEKVRELPFTMEDLTILIAEDEEFNYELMEILLARKVKKLIRACNGREVLSQLESQMPDLVLMDLKMPEMDGYEATRRAMAIYPDLRVIALTAFTQPEDERRAKDAGCCDFISKPIRKQDLFEAIRKNIRGLPAPLSFR